MNFAGHHRRSVSTGWQVGFGNIGGIIATFSFLGKDAPFYTKGLSIGLGFSALCIITVLIYLMGIRMENRAKRAGRYDERWAALTDDQKRVAGDLRPSFFYETDEYQTAMLMSFWVRKKSF